MQVVMCVVNEDHRPFYTSVVKQQSAVSIRAIEILQKFKKFLI